MIRPLLLPRTYLVAFSRTRHPRSVADDYKREATVAYAEPNFVRRYATTFPNDDYLSEQWGLHNRAQVINGTTGTSDADVDAPEAWEKETGSSDVVVGVVDTGIDFAHIDLAQSQWFNGGEIGVDGVGADKRTNCVDDDGNGVEDDWRGYDFVERSFRGPDPCVLGADNPVDETGHGTHVAGIIGARGNNGVGISGVAWRSKLASLRACDSIGCVDDAVADALYYAGNKMGMPSREREPHDVERQPIRAPSTARPSRAR